MWRAFWWFWMPLLGQKYGTCKSLLADESWALSDRPDLLLQGPICHLALWSLALALTAWLLNKSWEMRAFLTVMPTLSFWTSPKEIPLMPFFAQGCLFGLGEESYRWLCSGIFPYSVLGVLAFLLCIPSCSVLWGISGRHEYEVPHVLWCAIRKLGFLVYRKKNFFEYFTGHRDPSPMSVHHCLLQNWGLAKLGGVL